MLAPGLFGCLRDRWVPFCVDSIVKESMFMFKSFRLVVGLAMLAVCSVSMVAATAAQAETTLPEFMGGVANTFTTKSGLGTLFGADPIVCKKDKGSGTIAATGRTGTWTTDFEECSVTVDGVTLKCFSLGDKGETILVGGTWSVARGPSTDPNLILLTISPELHIICTGLIEVLIRVRGSVLGLIDKVSTTVYRLLIHAKSATTQEVKEATNNAGEKFTDHLECSVGPGAFEECAEEGGEVELTAAKATELLES